MTPRGVYFSRAPPFMKSRESHVQPLLPLPSSFVAPHRWKSPIISPDRDSKPAISRTRFFTLIAMGICGDQKTREEPITRPPGKHKPKITPGQEEHLEKRFVYLLQKPRPREWPI